MTTEIFAIGSRLQYFGRGPLNGTLGTVVTPRVGGRLADRWVTVKMDRDGETWDLEAANCRAA